MEWSSMGVCECGCGAASTTVNPISHCSSFRKNETRNNESQWKSQFFVCCRCPFSSNILIHSINNWLRNVEWKRVSMSWRVWCCVVASTEWHKHTHFDSIGRNWKWNLKIICCVSSCACQDNYFRICRKRKRKHYCACWTELNGRCFHVTCVGHTASRPIT